MSWTQADIQGDNPDDEVMATRACQGEKFSETRQSIPKSVKGRTCEEQPNGPAAGK